MSWRPYDDEQQSAEELDRLITALQQGQQLTPQFEEGQMAQKLMQAAAYIQPRQQFVAGLRAQLAVQASSKAKTNKGFALLPLLEEWARKVTMKNTFVSMAGLTAIIIAVFGGWYLFRSSVEVAEIADDTIAIVTEQLPATETAVVTKPEGSVQVAEDEIEATAVPAADAAGLPTPGNEVDAAEPEQAINQSAYSGDRGGGGGGGYGFGEGQGPFTDASISLNAELPLEAEAIVYSVITPNATVPDLESMRVFAEALGINGEIYFEWYSGISVNGQDDGSGNIPYAYRIFDGKRQISAYLSGEMYYEDTSLYSLNLPPMPFAERAAIAERFLQERNLLDFDYEIHPGWGNEVQFLPLVDNRPVNNWSLQTVNVAGDGQIISVYIRPLNDLVEIRTESLRSAAEAWQYLQDNFAAGVVMFNIIASDPNYYAPPFANGEKTHWELEFAAGQEVNLISWIQVYRPADGSITPRLITDRGMVLAADSADLEAIAEAAVNGNIIRLQGTLSGEVGSLILNISEWAGIVSAPTDVYLNGTTRLINGIVMLELPGGFPIQIANPPADLPLDAYVSMYSWSIRVADDGVSAIADWVYFDLTYGIGTEQNGPNVDPFSNITGVTIDKVELVYNYLYPYEAFYPYSGVPFFADDDGHLAPAWRFTGTTNKGDLIEFIVPASPVVELPAVPSD